MLDNPLYRRICGVQASCVGSDPNLPLELKLQLVDGRRLDLIVACPLRVIQAPVEGGLQGEGVREHQRLVQPATILLIQGTSALESPERLSSPLSHALVGGPMTLRAAHALALALALIPGLGPGEHVLLHHPLGKVPLVHAARQH